VRDEARQPRNEITVVEMPGRACDGAGASARRGAAVRQSGQLEGFAAHQVEVAALDADQARVTLALG